MIEMNLFKPNDKFLMLTFPVSDHCDSLCDPESPWIHLNFLTGMHMLFIMHEALFAVVSIVSPPLDFC